MTRTSSASGARRPAAQKAAARSRGNLRARERSCSIARTVAILSDGWGFMILRESYFGVSRFDAFQRVLGLPRATHAARQRKLTEQGLLRQAQYSASPPRYEYRLTRIGFDLYAVMITLMRFGDKWLAGPEGLPLELYHSPCGHRCHPLVACSHCNGAIDIREVDFRDGPGAGSSRPYPWASRRSADPTALERRRPSMVARSLKFIGDRWSFMVLREAFFGVQRFDDFRQALGIAPNILADRLNRLTGEGVFERARYQTAPERFEYRLTAKGRDLAWPLLAMLRWGDQWLSGGEPPLLLTHRGCGHDFVPQVVCDHCRGVIQAGDMRYRMRYTPPDPGQTLANDRALLEVDAGG
jgi:DNA-binding HxlR family transcriptional regulator